MLSKPAIGLAVVAVGASVYVKYYGFPDLQQQPASVQAELERAASMRTGEPMVLILGYLLFFITAGAFMFESGQAVVCAVRRYRWKPAELRPLQPVSEADRAAAAAASSQADDQQQQPDKQQQARQQQPSATDHDERRRRALEALQREHDEKAAAAQELQKQQDAERAARRAAAAAQAAATAAAEAANQHASATAAASHWERWEQAMVQQYGAGDTNGNTNAAAAPQAASAAAAAAAAAPALTQQQQADLDASRLVRQEQDEEFQASLAADAQKRKEREDAALLKRLKSALAGALPPEAAAAAASADGTSASADNAGNAAGSTTLAIRVRLPDGSNAVRQFAGVQSFADVLDWVYALPGMPLLLPGAWGLASSFPRRQLAAAAGLWAPAEKAANSTGKSGVNLSVNFAGVEECIEAGSSLGIAGRQRGGGGEAGYAAAPADAMSLCIRPLVGEAVTVQVLQRSSILEVKRQVEQQTGLLPEDQRLIFAGQVLDDAQTLQHYKISAQHTLQLAPRAGASIRTGSSSSSGGGGAPEAAAAAAVEPPAAATAAAADDAGEASGLLVVSTVAQLREDVAHGASQLALYVVES